MDGKYDSVAYKYIITRIFALTSFSPYSYTIFQIYNLIYYNYVCYTFHESIEYGT